MDHGLWSIYYIVHGESVERMAENQIQGMSDNGTA